MSVKRTIFQVPDAVNVKITLLVIDVVMCGFGRLYCRHFRAISQNSLTLIKKRKLSWNGIMVLFYNFSKSASVSFFRWKTVYLGLEYGNNAWKVRESSIYHYLRQSIWDLRLLETGLCSAVLCLFLQPIFVDVL